MRPLPQVPIVDDAHTLPPCLDRRAFLSNSAMLAAAALLATACGDGQLGGGLTNGGPVNVTVKLADYPTLGTVGAIARLTGVSTPIAVVRESASVYRAFSLVCPHEGTTVLPSGTGFLCPNHEARFSGAGKWLGGQVTSSLREFTVTSNAAAGTLVIAS